MVKILLAVVLAATNLLSPLTGDKRAKIERAEENCNASFAVLSDTHVKDNFIRQGMLELGLADLAEAKGGRCCIQRRYNRSWLFPHVGCIC